MKNEALTPWELNFRSVFDDDVSTHCARGSSIETHSHAWLELAYLMEGNILHTVDGVTYAVSPGEYFIIEQRQPHSYISVPPQRIRLMNVLFTPRLIDPALDDFCHLDDLYERWLVSPQSESQILPQMKFSDPDGSVGRLIEAIFREVDGKRVAWKEAVRGLLIYIIIHTLRDTCMSNAPDGRLRFSQPIIDYVQSQYMKPIHIGDAFEGTKYSTSYLSRQFHRETGVTFSTFLMHTRIDASCHLLVNTDRPIAEISEAVGYHDTTFFHNTFRRIKGMTPYEFRKRLRPGGGMTRETV